MRRDNAGEIHRHPRLGGLLNYYERVADCAGEGDFCISIRLTPH